jgi:hypothetical protein
MKLNCLKTASPYKKCAVHQCTCYCNNPKVSHAEDIKWIGTNLAATKDQGIKYYAIVLYAMLIPLMQNETEGDDLDTR